ncbi:MAG: ABC transporter permease [Streptococcaceae bacterium]|nr:ABC transporter permease [Streptococcaceae bacterium]
MEMNIADATMNLQNTKQWTATLESESKSNPEDTTLRQDLLLAQEVEKLYSAEVLALKNKDLDKFTDLENQVNILQLKAISEKDSQEYRDLVSSIKYYDAVKKVKGKVAPIINDTSEAAFVTGRSALSWLSSTVIFVLLTVLIADVVSGEIESSQIRFYQLMGGRKFKHLLLKLLIPIMVVFSVTLLSFLLQYVINGLMNTFGTWRYPYQDSDSRLIPIWQVMLKTLGLFTATLLFIASLGQFLSLIFKKSLVVIGIIVILLTGFLTFEGEEWFQPIKKFLPFEYLGYGRLLNDVEILPSQSFMIGLFYLLSLSVVFILFSGYLYKHYYYRKVGQS